MVVMNSRIFINHLIVFKLSKRQNKDLLHSYISLICTLCYGWMHVDSRQNRDLLHSHISLIFMLCFGWMHVDSVRFSSNWLNIFCRHFLLNVEWSRIIYVSNCFERRRKLKLYCVSIIKEVSYFALEFICQSSLSACHNGKTK